MFRSHDNCPYRSGRHVAEAAGHHSARRGFRGNPEKFRISPSKEMNEEVMDFPFFLDATLSLVEVLESLRNCSKLKVFKLII